MDTKRLILIAEDDENDIEMLRSSIRQVNVPNPIQVVRDGAQAIDYLCGNGRYEDRIKYPFPGALFLDLKLPKLSGFEVLQWLKENEECKVIPVIVLSASGLERDVTKAYQMGANSYIVKPSTLGELRDLVDLAFRF